MTEQTLNQLKQLIDASLSAGFYIAYIDDLEEAKAKDLLGMKQRESLKEIGFTSRMLEEKKRIYFIFDLDSIKCDENTLKLRGYIQRAREEKKKSLANRGVNLTLSLKDAEALINALDYLLRAGDIISKADKGSITYIKGSAEQQAEKIRQALALYTCIGD